jgi:hypothetical protein
MLKHGFIWKAEGMKNEEIIRRLNGKAYPDLTLKKYNERFG